MEQRVDRGTETGRDHFGEFVLHRTWELQVIRTTADIPDGPFPPLGRQDHLAGGEEHEFGNLPHGALGALIEDTDRFQLVAQKIHSERMRRRWRVEIDHVSADAELPLPFHKRHAAVPPLGQLSHKLVPFPDIADRDPFRIAFENPPRHHPLHQCADGKDGHGRMTVDQPVESLESIQFRLPLECKQIRCQEVPRGQQESLLFTEEEGQIPDKDARLLLRRRDHDDRTAQPSKKKSYQERAGRPLQAADSNALFVPLQPLQQPPHCGVFRNFPGVNDFSHKRHRKKITPSKG